MPFNIFPYNQAQSYLLPPSLADWVPGSSLVRMVNDVVELLEESGRLRTFYRDLREDGRGAASYHPRMLLKVLLYSYCRGETSSRKIAGSLETDISLRFLSANSFPDHRTLSDFRKNHLTDFLGVFVDVLRLCQEAGLARMGRVALDGRKVAGNAALKQNRTREGLEKEVKSLLDEAERVDAVEDTKMGKERRGDELPKPLRTASERLSRLREAQARLAEREKAAQDAQVEKLEQRTREEAESGKKKRGRKPKPPEEVAQPDTKANMTDPDSRILKTRRSWVQGYNGQAAADTESQVIVAHDVTQAENDVQQLVPMLARAKEQAGQQPGMLLADAGYWSQANAAVGGSTELLIATTKDWKQRKLLQEKGAPRGRIPKSASPRDRMERKLLTKRGRAAYKLRGSTIEPVFGQMVMRGLTHFRLRGIEKVRAEWALWCATHNILKLWRAGWQRQTA